MGVECDAASGHVLLVGTANAISAFGSVVPTVEVIAIALNRGKGNRHALLVERNRVY